MADFHSKQVDSDNHQAGKYQGDLNNKSTANQHDGSSKYFISRGHSNIYFHYFYQTAKHY